MLCWTLLQVFSPSYTSLMGQKLTRPRVAEPPPGTLRYSQHFEEIPEHQIRPHVDNNNSNNSGHNSNHGNSYQNTSTTLPQDPTPSQNKRKRKKGKKMTSQPEPDNPPTGPKIKKTTTLMISSCRRCHTRGQFPMDLRKCCRLVACTSCGPYTYQFKNSVPCIHRRQEIEENKRKAAALLQDIEGSETEADDDEEGSPRRATGPASARRSNVKRSRK